LIEPNASHNGEIYNRGFEVHNLLLSDRIEEKKFYSSNGTGDSYYPELDNLGDTSNFKTLTSTTLDTFLLENPDLDRPDFIKIDTQGAELDILKGASNTLATTKLVLLELPIIPYNLGAPSLSDAVNFMIRANFVPVYLTEIHKLREVLVQIDIAFLKREVFENAFGNLNDRGYWHTALRHLKSHT